MDFLTQIWGVWSGGIGTAILTVLTVVLLTMNAAERFHRVSSATVKWKGWLYLHRCYRTAQNRYRIYWAKRVVLALLDSQSWRISIESYDRCLSQDRLDSGLDVTANLVPTGPRWLNDFYVASALEALHSRGKITKAKLFDTSGWPTRAIQYRFRMVPAGTSALDETKSIETDSYCMAYQGFFDRCPTGRRYESEGYAETKSVGRVEFGTRTWKKESAPPCQRCWETQYLGRDIRMLVDSITEHDLARSTTTEITGIDSEFQKAVTVVCENNRCPTEVPLIKSVVEKGVAIRQLQIETLKTETQVEWPEDLAREFSSLLDDWVKENLQSRQA